MKTTLDRPRISESQETFSGKFLLLGVAIVVLGLIALAASFVTTTLTIMVLGSVLLAAGIVEISHAFGARRHRNIALNVLSAILYMTVGCSLLYNPLVGALGLTLIASLFLLLAGIVRIVHGIAHIQTANWGWFVFGGFIDLTLAALIMLGWPTTAFWVIGMFVAIELIVYGFTTIGLAGAIKEIEESNVLP